MKTADLKFLLLPHYTAGLTILQSAPGGAEERLGFLTAAMKEWRFFVSQCEHYGLVRPEELAVFHREVPAPQPPPPSPQRAH